MKRARAPPVTAVSQVRKGKSDVQRHPPLFATLREAWGFADACLSIHDVGTPFMASVGGHDVVDGHDKSCPYKT